MKAGAPQSPFLFTYITADMLSKFMSRNCLKDQKKCFRNHQKQSAPPFYL